MSSAASKGVIAGSPGVARVCDGECNVDYDFVVKMSANNTKVEDLESN